MSSLKPHTLISILALLFSATQTLAVACASQGNTVTELPGHDHYGPLQAGGIAPRKKAVLISSGRGKALGYALFNLQERGRLFSSHGDDVYEGQVIGIHSRSNDLVVNPLKGKQLTNVRASGKDDAIALVPPIPLTLEMALEFIEDDELVEITPGSIRLRKKLLLEHERKRASRG